MDKADVKETLNGINNDKFITPMTLKKWGGVMYDSFMNSIIETDWQKVSYQNGWTNYYSGSGNYDVYYKKIGKVVYLQGRMSSCSASSNIAFTLPVGFRPATIINVQCTIDSENTAAMQINPDGTVQSRATGIQPYMNLSFIVS